MSLQFILGGSGRGKTSYLQNMIIKEAFENQSKNYFMIVPEQFTMQTQKNFITLSDTKGIMNIEVQSFARLAFRILSETGAGNEPVIDDMGKTMILKKVLSEKKDELKYFSNNINKKGYVSEIKSFLSELIQYGVDGQTIDKMIETADNKPLLSAKLKDMSVAYRGFLDYIENHYITSEEVISVFSSVVGQSQILKDSVICLDGFTGFTPLQYRLISELMKVAERVYVTATISKGESIATEGAPHQLFHMSRKMICTLRKMALDQNIDIQDEIWLENDDEKSRYKNACNISKLERKLFRYNNSKKHIECPDGNDSVSIHLLKQPESEVAFVVREIKKLLCEKKCRYRDIAVITGDLETYGVIIDQAMEKAQIPCFIDQKKSVLSNPFVDAVDALLDMFIKDFAYDKVMKYLKGSFSFATKQEADIIDNFLLASGIRGNKKWRQQWECYYVYRKGCDEVKDRFSDVVNGVRQTMAEEIIPLYDQIAKGKRKVSDYATAICLFFEKQGYYKKIKELSEDFAEKGELLLAKEYDQIYEIVLSVFDRLVELLGDEEMNLSEFKELLDVGLSEARIGLIPPGVDQVVAGDILRTRIGDIKYLFFVGATDVNIPKSSTAGGIISDSERNFLSEEKFQLAPTSRELVYQEQFYLYLNLTKPETHLYITYCESGNDGKPQNASYIIEKIKKIIPELEVMVEDNIQDDVHILADDMGIKYLIDGFRRRDFEDDKWRQLYAFYKNDKETTELIDKIENAAFYKEMNSQISKEAAVALYHRILYGSTSQFEKFAACAFSYFMRYGLKLNERQEHKVEFFDIGNIVHDALDLYTQKLIKEQKQWGDLSEEEQHVQANLCLDEAVENYKNGLMYDTERDTYMVSRIRNILLRTIWAITEQMKTGKFNTVESEFSFDILEKNQEESLKSDELLHLIGRVDRIDVFEENNNSYVKVVDYKTGEKNISLSDMYYGLQMQLIVYLKAGMDMSEQEGEKNNIQTISIPAGVLYYNIDDPMLDGTKDNISKENIPEKILMSLMGKGMLNSDNPVLPAFDKNFDSDTGEFPESLTSLVAPFATIKEGELSKSSSVINTKDFKKIIDYTRKNILSMKSRIMNGDTQASPYKKPASTGETACKNCLYSDICRFDARIDGNDYRILKKLSDDDVIYKLYKEQSEE